MVTFCGGENMAAKVNSAFSCFPISLSPPHRHQTSQLFVQRGSVKGKPCTLKKSTVGQGVLKVRSKLPRRQLTPRAVSHADFPDEEVEIDVGEPEKTLLELEEDSPTSISSVNLKDNGGKPGFISFYSLPQRREDGIHSRTVRKKKNGLLLFIGPAVLVASFVFPSLYLRRVLSTIFEDSLLTDFLILFFTEALFYCGVGIFLVLMDYLWRHAEPISTATTSDERPTPVFWHRISSVAILMLSLIIPLVTMGYVWPWTGPAASATLAPYLVGIVVQFAFEQYAKYVRSPSWPVIPIIFQVYRLHQLNRAAQLVTALTLTVRGTEMTTHNSAINSSLGTLLNVLQLLGVICIWSLSSFLLRFLPASHISER